MSNTYFIVGTVLFTAAYSVFAPPVAWHYTIAFGGKTEMNYKRDYIRLLPVSAILGAFACLCSCSESASVCCTIITAAIATGPFWMSHPATLIGVPIFLILGLIGAMCG